MKKNYIKKIVLMATVASILASGLLGCGGNSKGASNEEKNDGVVENFNATGYPVVNEKIELNGIALLSSMHGDWNTMKILQSIDDKTGVEVVYEQLSGEAWTEQKNLMFASNDLPDFFIGPCFSDTDVAKYGSQGMLIPLEDLIDKYAPNIKKLFEDNPTLKKLLTAPDGHIYTLPYYDEYMPESIPDNLFINKKWLDTLGLEVPKTTDEFYEVMKAFKTQDPNGNGKADEIPFSGVDNYGEYSMYGSFGKLDNGKHLQVNNGKLEYTVITEEYKEATKWFAKLYQEGLMDKEFFTQDFSQLVSKGKDTDATVGSFVYYFSENIVGNERAYEEYIPLDPLVGEDGTQTWNRYTSGYYLNHFAIGNSNESPEATIRWIDEFFDDETSVQVHWGGFGESLEKQGDKIAMLNPPDGKSPDEYRYITSPAFHGPGVMRKEVYDKIEFTKDRMLKMERYNQYDKYATKEPLPVFKFTAEELDELATITTDLNNYINEMKGKWVTGASDIDKDWDGYVEQLKKMQYERYVEIHQQAFERIK